MRRIIIIGGVIFGLVVFTLGFIYLGDRYFPVKQVPTKEQASIIAESWIRNFSSYPVYGKKLELKSSEETSEGFYEFVFDFEIDNPEYGIHEREMEVHVDQTEVLFAVTDGIFDEKKETYLTKEEEVDVYFITEENNKKKLVAVKRSFSLPVEDSLKEKDVVLTLLEGPNLEEKMKGYITFLDDDAELVSFDVRDKVAHVEIFSPSQENLEIAKEQVTRTVVQLDKVNSAMVDIYSEEKEDPEEPENPKESEVEGVPEEFVFSRHMALGSFGEDVRYLQIVLNSDPDTVLREEGVGSPGSESEYYGYLTAEAVKKFQEKYEDEVLKPGGFWKGTGHVGDRTIEKLNKIIKVD